MARFAHTKPEATSAAFFPAQMSSPWAGKYSTAHQQNLATTTNTSRSKNDGVKARSGRLRRRCGRFIVTRRQLMFHWVDIWRRKTDRRNLRLCMLHSNTSVCVFVLNRLYTRENLLNNTTRPRLRRDCTHVGKLTYENLLQILKSLFTYTWLCDNSFCKLIFTI